MPFGLQKQYTSFYGENTKLVVDWCYRLKVNESLA
jgi:hypothetical protein